MHKRKNRAPRTDSFGIPKLTLSRSNKIPSVERRRSVVVITTAKLHSTKPELRFCAGSYPARGVSEIRDGEDL